MAKKSVIFLGSGQFSVEVFKILHFSEKFNVIQVFSLPNKPVGRKQVFTATPFRQFAESLGYNVFLASNSSEIISQVTDAPDFLIVTDFGIILSEELLSLSKIENLNVHASLLPKYRGASPIQSAILNDDEIIGVSVMKVVKKMDAGAVYSYSQFPLNDSENYSSLIFKLGDLGGNLLVDTILKIEDISPLVQDETKVTYCRKILKSDGLVDFNSMTAREIFCKFRAFSEWPKTYFEHKSKKFQLVEIELCDFVCTSLFEISNKILYVKTKEGSLKISKFKPESKNEMNIDQFLAGNSNFFD